MANPPPSSPTPMTQEQFLADRMQMWGGFTGATKASVIAMVLLLAGMAFFLL